MAEIRRIFEGMEIEDTTGSCSVEICSAEYGCFHRNLSGKFAEPSGGSRGTLNIMKGIKNGATFIRQRRLQKRRKN